jgi:hypothetical protein
MTFEPDSPWHKAIVTGIPSSELPGEPNAHNYSYWIEKELLQWNPRLRSDLKNIRILCRPEALEREKLTVMISFSSQKGLNQLYYEGVCFYGKLFQPVPYRSQRLSPER